MKVNELDNPNLLLRKGLLEIKPRNIILSCELSIDTGPDTKEDISQYSCLKRLLIKGLRSKKYKLFLPAVIVSFKSKNMKYEQGYSMIYFDTPYRKLNDIPEKDYIKHIRYRGDLHKNLLPEEWKQEMLEEKTILEWWQFRRKIIRHLRRLMLDGKLKNVLNKFDKLKVARNHDEIYAEVKEAMTGLITVLEPAQAYLDGIPERFQPFINVKPYSGTYYALERFRDLLTQVMDDAEELRDNEGDDD